MSEELLSRPFLAPLAGKWIKYDLNYTFFHSGGFVTVPEITDNISVKYFEAIVCFSPFWINATGSSILLSQYSVQPDTGLYKFTSPGISGVALGTQTYYTEFFITTAFGNINYWSRGDKDCFSVIMASQSFSETSGSFKIYGQNDSMKIYFPSFKSNIPEAAGYLSLPAFVMFKVIDDKIDSHVRYRSLYDVEGVQGVAIQVNPSFGYNIIEFDRRFR